MDYADSSNAAEPRARTFRKSAPSLAPAAGCDLERRSTVEDHLPLLILLGFALLAGIQVLLQG